MNNENEIEVTDAMIDSGVDMLGMLLYRMDTRTMMKCIYRAMAYSAPKNNPQGTQDQGG
jgi:hypothetical protein